MVFYGFWQLKKSSTFFKLLFNVSFEFETETIDSKAACLTVQESKTCLRAGFASTSGAERHVKKLDDYWHILSHFCMFLSCLN